MADQLLAASRDASVWDRPNTRTRKKMHVAVNVEALPGTWWDPHSAHGEAACDPGRMVLDMSVASPADSVPPERRCRRPGCVGRWPDEALATAVR